jgi:hypothetical protein
MLFQQALLTGVFVSVLTSILIFASLAYNPRLWIQDMPKPMQAAIPSLSRREQRDRILFGIPTFLAMLAPPVWAVLQWKATHGAITFGQAFLFLFTAWMTFNLVDLVLIDWLVIVAWQPKRFTVPGTEHLMHLNNYSYHFKAFLKGTAMIAVLSGIMALLVSL